MKSIFIACKNSKNSYSSILEMLLKTLNCELTVSSVEPEFIYKAVKSAVKTYRYIFISGDFINTEPYIQLYKNFIKNSETYADDNGKILGEYSIYKNSIISVIPTDEKHAENYITAFFGGINSKENFEYFKSGTIQTTDLNTDIIEQTLSEYLVLNNPEISIIENSIFTEIKITAFGHSKTDAEALLKSTSENIALLLGDDVFSVNEPVIEKTVVNLLINNNIKISTAESCTGGMMSEKITAVPNSSTVFELGIASYSNRIKHYALSVSDEILKNYGAVSKQTAAAMALGIKNLSGADLGIGITGVAGPSPSEGKPVGTVYIALYDGKYFWVRLLSLPTFSSRDEIRAYASFTAFDLVRRYIECSPLPLPEGSSDIQNIICLTEQPHFKNSSYLFIKDSINKNEISDFSQDLNFDNTLIEPNFDFGITTSKPLESLRKKVIKKHRVKNKFTPPDIKEIFKSFAERLYSTTDIKGFIFNYLYKATALILVSAIIMITFLAGDTFYGIYENNVSIEKARSLWTNSDIKTSNGSYYDFENLKTLNPQISGWITIENTVINNPICNYRENEYYLTHNHLNEKSNYGTLYFSKNSDIYGSGINTVIYGTSPGDGSLFAELINYKNRKFANNAPIIELTTLYSKNKYRIFAVITTTDNPAHEYTDEYFNFEKSDFYNETDFDLWITEAKLRSIYDCSIPVHYGDNIITLVTDSNEFSSAKLLVMAVKIDETSSSYNYTLKVNSAPKFPKIWYNVHNLKNPYIYE